VKSKRLLIVGAVSVAIAGMLLLSSRISFSGALTGRVLDADTGKGVDGAVVVATWMVQAPINAVPIRYVELQETRTDANGEFHLSAWGPLFRGGQESAAPGEPVLRIVRPGFRPVVEFVMSGTPRQRGEIVLKMEKEKASLAEQADILRFVGSSTVSAFFAPPFGCQWQRIPRYLEALKEADAELIAQGQASSLPPEFSGNDSFGCAK